MGSRYILLVFGSVHRAKAMYITSQRKSLRGRGTTTTRAFWAAGTGHGCSCEVCSLALQHPWVQPEYRLIFSETRDSKDLQVCRTTEYFYPTLRKVV